MIADSPDAMRETLTCAWCERPLAGVGLPYGASFRCPSCGTRTGAAPTLTLPPEEIAVARSRCAVAETLRRRAHRRIAQRIERMAPPGPVLDVRGDLDVTALGGRYAAIVFWQSLGRTAEPGTALEHAAALLKPAGLLTIAQPAAGLPALTERLRGGTGAPPQRVRIPQRTLVERLRALGLEVLHADGASGLGIGGLRAALLDGVVSVEARR
ncbi:hypothetical protein Q5424_05995 [Conexibacter sp. JD483]|uniref:methyltransferase domain-containing protein n=1 Tax=unclassified Conexibacter TaxID=2627773 RepID=UPI002716D4BB|nr:MULTISPECIES: methyltransferase domain-containing protein [unclassified Conexibacter]MDO8185134.1 hypothetical protein [Conexibacter sp. CPCC 205706]MDO8196844.1 hypothetical protein [Conexibacter sp. CPCC 205762]MDR9368620.1 hypothetical protein [Conexibacter sp. JD483]